MHDRKAVDNGSRQPGAQEVSVTKKNNQCSGVTGQILANTLELSNVGLAAEFVKMTIMERGFQANSRMVSTSDELMTELVNLKRS